MSRAGGRADSSGQNQADEEFAIGFEIEVANDFAIEDKVGLAQDRASGGHGFDGEGVEGILGFFGIVIGGHLKFAHDEAVGARDTTKGEAAAVADERLDGVAFADGDADQARFVGARLHAAGDDA